MFVDLNPCRMNELNLIEIIAETYKFFRKYIILLIIFAIIGLVYGLFKKRNNPVKYYESSIYATTGLLYSPRGYEPYVNALLSDLKIISTKITDTTWVKSYFNVDSTTFLMLNVTLEDKNIYRYNAGQIKLTLRAKSYEDFKKFRQGLVFYFNHRTPLLSLYRNQQKLRREIKGPLLKNVIKSTLSVIDSNEVSVNFSSNTYDAYVLADIILNRPLFYFTSDFAKIRQKRSEQNLSFYIVIFLVLGIFIALTIEVGIKTHTYLKQQDQ